MFVGATLLALGYQLFMGWSRPTGISLMHALASHRLLAV
jgi:hypothetical protein